MDSLRKDTRTTTRRLLAAGAVAVALLLAGGAPAVAATSSLTGTLVGPNGEIPTGLLVSLQKPGSVRVDESLVDAEGRFTLDGLEDGIAYALWVDWPVTSRDEPVPYVSGFLTLNQSDPVTVDASKAFIVRNGVQSLTAPVEAAFTVEGRITRSGGTAVGPTEVIAQHATGPSGQSDVSATTASDGRYVLRGLEAGGYRIQLHDNTANKFLGWLRGSPGFGLTTRADAQVVSVGPRSATDVNALLPSVRMPTGVLTVSPDLDGDGRDEILSASMRVVSLFSLRADGTLDQGRSILTTGDDRSFYAPGQWDGDGGADLVSKDATGRLYLHPGNGDGSFGQARQIASGWSALRVLTPGDWNGDRRTDLITIDASGQMLLYRGNGTGGFVAPAVSIGGGWGPYRVTAAGNVDGTGGRDLLAVDGTGVMWLYPGRGDGTFLTRRQVGGGWTRYDVAAGGNPDAAGAPDIVARDTEGLYLYPGRGDGGFQPRNLIATAW